MCHLYPYNNVKLLRKFFYINTYIIVNFQLRSSIHAGLTERSLYHWFALKNLPKWGFWGRGQDIWWEPPSNAMTADLRRLVKKLWRCSK